MSEDETLIDFRGVKIVPEEAKLIEEIEVDMGVNLSINTLRRNDNANFVVDKGHVIKINLRKKKFKNKHKHIFKFPKIQDILLIKTEIQTIPIEVNVLLNLESLVLLKSNLKSIEANFDKLPKLLKIYISEGHIDRIPLLPQQVHKFSLKNCGINDFPNELKVCKNLKKLNLSGNNISIIPKWFYTNKNSLIDLDLSETMVQEIPKWFSEFHQIESLIFENTPVKMICDLSRMKNLAVIYLKGSNLNEFPLSLLSLTNLSSISLGAKGFPKVPDIFGNKPDLINLCLNGFDLNDFPKSIAKCKKLEYLKLDYCLLDDAEPDFYGIENLRKISLVGCNLKEPHEAFIYKPRDSLDLRQNQIEKMPDDWLEDAHKFIVDKTTWKNPERPLDLSDDDYLIMVAALKGVIYRDYEGDLMKGSLSNIRDQLDVDFSDENVLFESDGETYPPEIMGLQHLPDGRAFIGMYAGGDWEYPVYLYIFRVGDEIYARTPHSSNTYNADTGRSFGHEVDQDEEGYEGYDEPYEMNAKLVLEEIKREMDEVEKSVK